MQITRIDLEGLELNFDVDVSNPLPLGLSIPGGKYALDVGGAEFFSSERVPQSALPASGVGRISLPASLKYSDIFNLVQNFRNEKEVPYGLRGAINVPIAGQSIELPFKHSGKFPVLKIPQISIDDISVEGLGVAIEATLANPNIFELGISDLGYALNLGDIELGRIQAATANAVTAGGQGKLSLNGTLSAIDAATRLLGGADLGAASLKPVGQIQTPFGPVNIGG